MSRIGKAIIAIPTGVTITEASGVVTVKGPKGELSQELTGGITIEQKEGELVVITWLLEHHKVLRRN